jgi:uncharacterized protein YigA (DUF484 family)
MTDSSDKSDIVDFQPSLVRKLQNDLVSALQTQDDITKGSRIYWQRVHAVHQAVLFLLEARSFNVLVNALQDEVCILLGFDSLRLYLSKPQNSAAPHFLARPVPSCFSGLKDKESFLVTDPAQLELLFPDEGGMLAVALALPLPSGLMVLASRDETRFDAGAVYEPYIFLAHVVERLISLGSLHEQAERQIPFHTHPAGAGSMAEGVAHAA